MNEELLALLRQLAVIVLRDPLVTKVLAEVVELQQRGAAAGDERLTTTEVQRIAKVKTPATVRKWIADGLLKAERIGAGGRALRVRRSDLEAFLKAGSRRRRKPEDSKAWARREVAAVLAKRGDRPASTEGLRLVGKP